MADTLTEEQLRKEFEALSAAEIDNRQNQLNAQEDQFKQEFNAVFTGNDEIDLSEDGPINAINQPDKIIEKSPLSFLERTKLGFATEMGKEIELAKLYGKENVMKLEGEDYVVRAKDERTGQQAWFRVDPKGLRPRDFVGDFADVVGEIPEIVGATIGGTAGAPAGPVGVGAGAAGGAATGEALQQAIGNILGVRPEPGLIDDATGLAFTSIINGVFGGAAATKLAKLTGATIGNSVKAIQNKFSNNVIAPIIERLTNMKSVFVKHGLENPDRVLNKANIADDAIPKVVEQFTWWFDNFSQATKNKFKTGMAEISKRNKSVQVDPSDFKQQLSTLVDEFNSAVTPGQKLSKTEANLIERMAKELTQKTFKGKALREAPVKEFLSVDEAIQLKRAIVEKLPDAAFKNEAARSSIQNLQLKLSSRISSAIRNALPDKELVQFENLNSNYGSFAKLRGKLAAPAKKERLDAARAYLEGIRKTEANGAVFKNQGERMFLQRAQQFADDLPGVPKNMMTKVDDVFAAQEWASTIPRLNDMTFRSLAASAGVGAGVGKVSGSTVGGALAGAGTFAAGMTAKELSKPRTLRNIVARTAASKRAISETANAALRFTGAPQIAANIVQNAKDQNGNSLSEDVKSYIMDQVNRGIDDKALRRQIIRDRIAEQI